MLLIKNDIMKLTEEMRKQNREIARKTVQEEMPKLIKDMELFLGVKRD